MRGKSKVEALLTLCEIELHENYAQKLIDLINGEEHNAEAVKLSLNQLKKIIALQFGVTVTYVTFTEPDPPRAKAINANSIEIGIPFILNSSFSDIKILLLHELARILRQRKKTLPTSQNTGTFYYLSGREYPNRAIELALVTGYEYETVASFVDAFHANTDVIFDRTDLVEDFLYWNSQSSFRKHPNYNKFITLADKYMRLIHAYFVRFPKAKFSATITDFRIRK